MPLELMEDSFKFESFNSWTRIRSTYTVSLTTIIAKIVKHKSNLLIELRPRSLESQLRQC